MREILNSVFVVFTKNPNIHILLCNGSDILHYLKNSLFYVVSHYHSHLSVLSVILKIFHYYLLVFF